MHRLSDPQQPAGGPARQGRAARGRWRECRAKLSPTKMASETIRIAGRSRKGPKIAPFAGRIRTGAQLSEFIRIRPPANAPQAQPVKTFMTRNKGQNQ